MQLLRNRGYSVRAEEEVLRARLETLDRELDRSFVFRGRLLEMYTQVRALTDGSLQAVRTEGSSVVSESSLNAVLEVSFFYFSHTRVDTPGTTVGTGPSH